MQSHDTKIIPLSLSQKSLETLMLFLISKDLWSMIFNYWNFDCANVITPDPKSRIQFTGYTFFKLSPFPDLADAAQCVLSGKPDKVEAIIEENKNPYLLTTEIKATDHRGYVYQGTLLQMAFAVGELFIRNNKDETMTKMIQRHVETRFGDAEVTRQQAIFQDWKIAADEKFVADSKALHTAWGAVVNSPAKDAKALVCDKKVVAAFNAFRAYLTPNPNKGFVSHDPDKLHTLAWDLFERQYYVLGGMCGYKNDFVSGQIINAIQVLYLTANTRQVLKSGLTDALRNPADVKRSDTYLTAANGHVLRLSDGFFIDQRAVCAPRRKHGKINGEPIDISYRSTQYFKDFHLRKMCEQFIIIKYPVIVATQKAEFIP